MTATKPGRTRIINRGRGHVYELDGERVPGVTATLSAGVPKPALVGWAARTVGEYVIDRLEIDRNTDHIIADHLIEDLRQLNEQSKYPERLAATGIPRVGLVKVMSNIPYAERDAAGNRGTEVHNLAEKLAAGETIDVPDELAGHIDSYLKFLDEWQPTDAILERVVINRRWKYMGRLDSIMTLPVLGRTLLDIKTSRSGPFEETALQLAAYAHCESMLEPDGTEVPMPEVDACAVVWLRADGYDLYRFEAGEREFRIFLYCYQVGSWLGSARDEGVKSEALRAPVIEGEDQ